MFFCLVVSSLAIWLGASIRESNGSSQTSSELLLVREMGGSPLVPLITVARMMSDCRHGIRVSSTEEIGGFPLPTQKLKGVSRYIPPSPR